MTSHDVKLSKTLSWVLRHQAVKQGLDMRDDGYVPCSQVLALLRRRCMPSMTMERIYGEVAACPKHRFELTPCKQFIRASRGHSIRHLNDAKMLKEITDASSPSIRGAVYGTSVASWPEISKSGIRRGGKNHIHIATQDSKNGFVIGAKTNASVLIYIDIASAMADGIKFYLAETGVVLTRGISCGDGSNGEDDVLPSKYFTLATFKNIDGTTANLLELE